MADPLTHTGHQAHEAAAGGTHHPAGDPIPAGHEAHAAHEVSHGEQHHPSSVPISSSSFIPYYGYPYYGSGYGYGYPYSRRSYDYGYDDLLDRYRTTPYRSPRFVAPDAPPRFVAPDGPDRRLTPKNIFRVINWPTLIAGLVIAALLFRK